MFMKNNIRDIIYNKYDGRCAYCGCSIEKNKWHIDHIEPIVRNIGKKGCSHPTRENIDNLNPSCISCNIQKHSYSIEQFRENIKYFVTSLNKYSNQYKFAKKYGLILETNNEVIFYFESLRQ